MDASTQQTPTSIYTFELPESLSKTAVSIDLLAIPQETRMELLKMAIAGTVRNRVNVANQRYIKAVAPFAALDAYGAALAAYNADPLTVANPGAAPEMPAGTRPAPFDAAKLIADAVGALLKGELKKKGEKGEAKVKTPKDPVDAAVTGIVVKEVYKKSREQDDKYTYLQAVKEVGASGIAYLNAKIEALVAIGGDKANLDKMLEARYLSPARILAGVDVLKGKNAELPNIL